MIHENEAPPFEQGTEVWQVCDAAAASQATSTLPTFADSDDGEAFAVWEEDFAAAENTEALHASTSSQATTAAAMFAQKYTRVAKRIDMKLLKENIWKEIQKQAAQKKHEISFTDVCGALPVYYGADAAAYGEISTSYCFICILHLANEHSLVLLNEQPNSLIIKNF